VKTVIHCYDYPELNTVYHVELVQVVSPCMMQTSVVGYLRVFVTTRRAAAVNGKLGNGKLNNR